MSAGLASYVISKTPINNSYFTFTQWFVANYFIWLHLRCLVTISGCLNDFSIFINCQAVLTLHLSCSLLDTATSCTDTTRNYHRNRMHLIYYVAKNWVIFITYCDTVCELRLRILMNGPQWTAPLSTEMWKSWLIMINHKKSPCSKAIDVRC